MYFSGKITSTILRHFSQIGEDIGPQLTELNLSAEALRDPSAWVPSLQLEVLLSKLQSEFALDEQKWGEIAFKAVELKTWGVLDSVLRIMPRVEEVWTQPEKILSYFVSPPPPVANVVRGSASIEFDVPILPEQYPLSTLFLQRCFECIPCFSGRSAAAVEWENIRLKINWQPKELSLFDQVDPGFQVSPELMRQLVFNLESNQRELEEKNADLQRKNEDLKLELSRRESAQYQSGIAVHESEVLRHQIARLSDYMIRAQQLVSLLCHVDKTQKTYRDAAHKLDWEFVKKQFPETMREVYRILDHSEATRTAVQNSSLPSPVRSQSIPHEENIHV